MRIKSLGSLACVRLTVARRFQRGSSGCECAEAGVDLGGLLEVCPSALVLASRSGAVARDANAEWEALCASGAAVRVERCDAGEAAHARRLVAATRAPSLDGVWHAAGVLADGVLPAQTAASLARVAAPKAHGAWALQLASATAALRACALFSSVAALLGGAGQANYSAANACLDALGTCRRANAQAGVSVQWGAWAEVGMAARGAASERMAAMEAASGFGRIGLAQGVAALATAVRPGGPAVLGVVPIAWRRFLGGAPVPAFLSAFAPVEAAVAGAVGAAASAPATARTAAVSLEAVLELVRRTAGGAVDADAPLMEAGVDSLGAVELRNQLQAAAVADGAALPSTLVFDHPTARQLAIFLQPSSHQPRRVTAPQRSQTADTVGTVAIGGMSALQAAFVSSLPLAWISASSSTNLVSEVPESRWTVSSSPHTRLWSA